MGSPILWTSNFRLLYILTPYWFQGCVTGFARWSIMIRNRSLVYYSSISESHQWSLVCLWDRYVFELLAGLLFPHFLSGVISCWFLWECCENVLWECWNLVLHNKGNLVPMYILYIWTILLYCKLVVLEPGCGLCTSTKAHNCLLGHLR